MIYVCKNKCVNDLYHTFVYKLGLSFQSVVISTCTIRESKTGIIYPEIKWHCAMYCDKLIIFMKYITDIDVYLSLDMNFSIVLLVIVTIII